MLHMYLLAFCHPVVHLHTEVVSLLVPVQLALWGREKIEGGKCESETERGRGGQGGPGLPRTVPYVQDVLGHPGTTQDVPAGEAEQGPRVPGPRCLGTSLDNPGCPSCGGRARSGPRCPGTSPNNPGCPSFGGRARFQSPRSKMSWDNPAVEAGQGSRVPGPRCPGIYQDIPGCPRAGGSVRSQSPRSKMSWEILGYPRMSQRWRQC